MRTSLLISALIMHDAFSIDSNIIATNAQALLALWAVFLIMDILELIFKAGK